ncbi:PadR family transcriptional regulator [Streptomyces sp. NPDC003247]|uniref:PadR family transcriptional regulator n=1 Tax=Streptomyces sp. NPDC003247 TaxID=3364677 RepID=UPI003699699D
MEKGDDVYNEDFPPLYDPYGVGRGGRRGRGRGWKRGGRFAYGGYEPAAGPPAGYGYGRRFGAGRWVLLTLLKAESPRSGAQLLQALEARSFGQRFPGPAFVHGTLRQLEVEGLVSGTDGESESGRTYELTEAGAAYVERLNASSGALALPSDGALGLRRAVHATSVAARQVAFTGSGDATEEATRLLDETRKKLYRLLADDGR